MKKIFLTLTLVLFVIPFGMSQDLPSYVPTDGLVAYYPFNGNANDESGNGNHGAVTEAVLTSDRNGKPYSAYSFSNNYEVINLPEISNDAGKIDTSFSVNIWFKPVEFSQGVLVHSSWDMNVNQRTWVYSRINLEPSIGIKIYHRNSSFNSEPMFTNIDTDFINNWHNITYVIDGQENLTKFYLNGSLVDDLSIDFPQESFYKEGRVWQIGNVIPADSGNPHVFKGTIDEVAFWNRALTEQEIQNLYTSSSGDILLNGVVSAENNQIKNVADPTHGKDAVTKDYLLEKISSLQDQIDALQSTSGSGTVTDQDGNSYPYLTYGDQVWTVKNAEMVTYRDGTPIPQVTDATEWANLTTGAWCYYDNDPSKGKLYNWYAVAGIHDNDENTPNKELAPEGWHVPTDAEWTELENYLIANGYNYDGTTTDNKIAKSLASTSGWNSSTIEGAAGNNQNLNNSSGFNAFPDGYRYHHGQFHGSPGKDVTFWTSSEKDNDEAHHRYIDNNNIDLDKNDPLKNHGFYLRLIRD